MSKNNNDPKRYTIEDLRVIFEHACDKLEIDEDVELLTSLADGLRTELGRSHEESLDSVGFADYWDRLDELIALSDVVRERVEVAQAILRSRRELFSFVETEPEEPQPQASLPTLPPTTSVM